MSVEAFALKQSELDLKARTRLRNQTVWSNWENYGSLAALTPWEADANRSRRSLVEGYLAAIDADLEVKEVERDRGAELAQAEIDQEMRLALEKFETDRRRLAIRMAADDYYLAAKQYEAQVKAIIMAAREYAAAMEREQALTEKARAELAVEKEHLRIQDLTAQVFLQQVERAMVEADVAKMKLQAAKARVDVVEAEVAMKRAEVDLIEAEVKEAMAEAEKATLRADVASIFAECLVKQLTAVKLDVETKEIEAGFRYIQTRLDEMLRLWDIRAQEAGLREEAEKKLLEELGWQTEEDKRTQDLRRQAAANDREALEYEIQKTDEAIDEEKWLREQLDTAKLANLNLKLKMDIRTLQRNLWADQVLNAARRWANKNQSVIKISGTNSYEYHTK
uniref:Uncharacterized protein n=1 Tax=Desulfobacca acetoxidans TaxID=60893 RepID=A0A7C3ZAS4_9BACT